MKKLLVGVLAIVAISLIVFFSVQKVVGDKPKFLHKWRTENVWFNTSTSSSSGRADYIELEFFNDDTIFLYDDDQKKSFNWDGYNGTYIIDSEKKQVHIDYGMDIKETVTYNYEISENSLDLEMLWNGIPTSYHLTRVK